MGKARKFFDFMTVFTVFMSSMAVSAVVNSGSTPGKGGSIMGVVVFGFLVSAFYCLSIIIVGIRKSTKFLHGLFIVIGSIFVPVIMPVTYYLTYLRALMDEPSAKEQFQQLVQTIQQNPQQFQQLTT